jgi:hypothetical protein
MSRLICFLFGHEPARHADQVWDGTKRRWTDIARYPEVNVLICPRCHANLNGWELRYR